MGSFKQQAGDAATILRQFGHTNMADVLNQLGVYYCFLPNGKIIVECNTPV